MRNVGRKTLILLVIPITLLTCLSGSAEAALDFFGEILFTGGRAENPALVDSSQPAELRRAQNMGSGRIDLGLRGKWEKSDFEISYGPYGEFYEQSELSQISHSLNFSWNHRYTPRLSLKVAEFLSYNPELPTDPNDARVGGALAAGTSIGTSDFKQTLAFRATEKSTLAWSFGDIERVYSDKQLLDTTGRAVGFEYSRTFGPHNTLSPGYQYAVYSFRDGVPLPATSTTTGPPPPPNNPPPPPPPPPNFCTTHPFDPNCIVPLTGMPGMPGLLSTGSTAAAPAISGSSTLAADSGFARHRGYVGYVYEFPDGFHFDLQGGYDFVVFDQAGAGSLSEPFVRTGAGWSGTRFYSRVGYEQGLDEGGGILTDARLRREQEQARIRFTINSSLELSATQDARTGLDVAGSPAGVELRTLRASGVFTYRLPRDWALLAIYTHDSQTATGTSVVPPSSQANRFAVGASWRFEK